jgi:hypothetical protein
MSPNTKELSILSTYIDVSLNLDSMKAEKVGD